MDTDNNLGINRRGYGLLEVGGYWRGAYFQHLESNSVEVCRAADDLWADQLFVRVWQPSEPYDYDSGWRDIAPGATLLITHGLNVSATELSVGLWFSGTAKGIHQFGYGSLSNDSAQEFHGAHWQNLTDNTIRVLRAADDLQVEQVRVVVNHADPPDYDSGWQPIGLGDTLTLDHNLDWPPLMLQVRAECKSAAFPGPGIHQQYAGGNHDWFIGWQGANIRNLTTNSVAVYRHVNDQVCPEARVRIWRRAYQVFLPFVARNW